MIKFIYEEKPYNYDHVGKQEYGIKSEYNINEDADTIEIIFALMRLLKHATYHVDAETLVKAACAYADEYDEWDKIKEYFNKEI